VSATRLHNILQQPHVTEKTSQMSGERSQYVFKVLPDANKTEIRQAVEQLLKVKVHSVQVCRMKGKSKRFGQRLGHTKGWKKAYVVLQEKQTLDLEDLK